jgi:hypothetical protein
LKNAGHVHDWRMPANVFCLMAEKNTPAIILKSLACLFRQKVEELFTIPPGTMGSSLEYWRRVWRIGTHPCFNPLHCAERVLFSSQQHLQFIYGHDKRAGFIDNQIIPH